MQSSSVQNSREKWILHSDGYVVLCMLWQLLCCAVMCCTVWCAVWYGVCCDSCCALLCCDGLYSVVYALELLYNTVINSVIHNSNYKYKSEHFYHLLHTTDSPCRTKIKVPGCVSLNLFKKELHILFLFLWRASELEFRYPSSSIDPDLFRGEEEQ